MVIIVLMMQFKNHIKRFIYTHLLKKKKITIQLIQDNSILITGLFTVLTDQRKEIIKKFGGSWDYEKKGWRCTMNQYYQLKAALEKTSIEVYGIPEFVNLAIQPFRDKLNFQTEKKNYEITYTIEDQNKDGIRFGLANNCRILIGDEMGVGKTIQAICLASCYKQAWPLMIICPSSLKYNWKEEILKWNSSLKEMQIQILSKQSEELYVMTKVLIVSYDLAPKIEEKIRRFKTNIVIADEAHYLKNAQAKRTNTLLPILQKIKHVILLTGTPAFARPKEMYTLLSIIRPDVFKVFKHFGDRYCDPKPARFGGGTDYTGSSNEKELFYILKKSIMIRRLKQDVLTQLPKKRRKKVHVNVDPKILSEIQSILNQTNKSSLEQLFDQANFDEEGSNSSGVSIFSALSMCYKLSGMAKLEELKNYIKDLLENDIKIIVFAHHLEMLNALEVFVTNDLKLKYIRIDGQVSAKNRFDNVQLFQTDPEVKVAILSLTAASTGLTLTASSNIVFAEMNWTPAIMQQAEDRAHRIGQENSVLCHYIVGEKTLDDMLYKKIEQKIAIVSNIIDGEQKRLKMDEVQNIDGDIKNFSSSNKKEDDQELIEDIEIQTGSTFSAKKEAYSQADYIKSLLEQKEKQKYLESQQQSETSNQIITEENQLSGNQNNLFEQKPTCQNNQMQITPSSDSEDDDEELFILKMIAQQQANKLKEKQNQKLDNNHNQNQNMQIEQNQDQINELKANNRADSNNLFIRQSQITDLENADRLKNQPIYKNVLNQNKSSVNGKKSTQVKNQNESINTTPSKSVIQSNNRLNQNSSQKAQINDDDFLFDSESENEQSNKTISLNFKSIQPEQESKINTQSNKNDELTNYEQKILSQKDSNHTKQSKQVGISTGYDFLDDAINSLNDLSQDNSDNNIENGNNQIPNQNNIIPSNNQQYKQEQNENQKQNQYLTISPIKKQDNHFDQHLKLQNSINPKKSFKKSVEKQSDGITKITFENGDVRFVTDSEGEDEDNNDQDSIILLDKKTFQQNKSQFINQKPTQPNPYFSKSTQRPIIGINNHNQNKQQNENSFSSPNYKLNGIKKGLSYQQEKHSLGQNKDNLIQIRNTDSDDNQDDNDQEHLHQQLKVENANQSNRKIRTREEFEESVAANNGISKNDLNNVFNQFLPQKQQQTISKKQIIKMQRQHF